MAASDVPHFALLGTLQDHSKADKAPYIWQACGDPSNTSNLAMWAAMQIAKAGHQTIYLVRPAASSQCAFVRAAEAPSEEQEVYADENVRPNRAATQKRPAPGQKMSRIPNVKARLAHTSS